MRYEIELHLPFHLAADLEWLKSRYYPTHEHIGMLQRWGADGRSSPRLHEPAIIRVFLQGILFLERPPAIYDSRPIETNNGFNFENIFVRIIGI